MTLKEFFSSGADSQDHKNFKIKPFNSIFSDPLDAPLDGKGKVGEREVEILGFKPPVIPKIKEL